MTKFMGKMNFKRNLAVNTFISRILFSWQIHNLFILNFTINFLFKQSKIISLIIRCINKSVCFCWGFENFHIWLGVGFRCVLYKKWFDGKIRFFGGNGNGFFRKMKNKEDFKVNLDMNWWHYHSTEIFFVKTNDSALLTYFHAKMTFLKWIWPLSKI